VVVLLGMLLTGVLEMRLPLQEYLFSMLVVVAVLVKDLEPLLEEVLVV
jgi:hypothetical protein